MIKKLNLVNIAQLLLLPVVYLGLADYQLAQGFILGLLSLSLFNQVHRYGPRAVIFKPNDDFVRRVFQMIEVNDLDGLRALTKNIPPKDLVEMSLPGLKTILIYAVDREKRDIIRWLVEEKGADVNKSMRNEQALQRAIFRNNELIVRDLLSYGADVDTKIYPLDQTMPVYTIVRNQPKLLDILLEQGASMQYQINGKIVDESFKNRDPKIMNIHCKHERWRRLRQWLKLDEQVGTGVSSAQKKIRDQSGYAAAEMSQLNHNLRRLLLENYY